MEPKWTLNSQLNRRTADEKTVRERNKCRGGSQLSPTAGKRSKPAPPAAVDVGRCSQIAPPCSTIKVHAGKCQVSPPSEPLDYCYSADLIAGSLVSGGALFCKLFLLSIPFCHFLLQAFSYASPLLNPCTPCARDTKDPQSRDP